MKERIRVLLAWARGTLFYFAFFSLKKSFFCRKYIKSENNFEKVKKN